MNAAALREALASSDTEPPGDDDDDSDDPVTVAGRALAKKLKLDDEGMDALTELITAVVQQTR